MRLARTYTAAIALIFFVFTGAAFAEKQKGKSVAESHKNMVLRSTAMSRAHGGTFRHAGMGHHSWKDTLDKAQREKIEALHLELKRVMAPLKAELAFRKAELRNLVTVKTPDMAAIKSKIRQISSIREKILAKRYSHIVKMRKVLKPEQRRSFDLEIISGAEHWRGRDRD
jgi:Spy/CpxP family protein refolding chaperone